jgi:two-component system sensor histidine kinase TtrS
MELDHELMMGHFAELRTTTFRGLLKNYRPYLITVLILLVGIVIHFIRVQILVKRRTVELRVSQAHASYLQRQAEHMARLSILGEMASTLAHELNQPLATIATYAQGLERHCVSGNINAKMVAEINSEIFAQTVRADKVIRHVRSFARKRMAARESRSIADTVHEAMDILSTMMPNLPPVTLDNRLSPGTMFKADHLQLQQVLFNLMRNAADSMLDLPSESRMINIILDRDDSGLIIAVVDHGPQVSAETLTHLFEPFFTTKPDGLGLGLAICKSIVEAHSGRLSVSPCDPPPGLVFLLNLPEFNDDE